MIKSNHLLCSPSNSNNKNNNNTLNHFHVHCNLVCKVLSLSVTHFTTLASHSNTCLSPSFNPQNHLGFHLSHIAQKFVSYCWYKPAMPDLVLQHLGKILLKLFPLLEILSYSHLSLSKSYLSFKAQLKAHISFEAFQVH